MAHGTPRINICKDCNHYTLVPRFSENPKCPSCGKVTEQTNKEKIREDYKKSVFYEFNLNFDKWTHITK